MTSFKAMRDTTEGLVKVLKVTSNDRYLSYLPVAHGMERWIGEVSVTMHCLFVSGELENLTFASLFLVHSFVHGRTSLFCRIVDHVRCGSESRSTNVVPFGPSSLDEVSSRCFH